MVLLGVNIDHVATLRNARGGAEPDIVVAALIAEAQGADGITVHLREDRRHIRDEDVFRLKTSIKTRLNLEMAATDEMIAIACQLKPVMVTLVPEKREELTTEGGLDVVSHQASLTKATAQLQAAGIEVSLFVDPDMAQLSASKATGATYVELHTGAYAHEWQQSSAIAKSNTLNTLMTSALHCQQIGLKLNAGHGLNYENVKPVCELPGLIELNIGHSIISRAVFTGLGDAVALMKSLMTQEAQSHSR